MLAQRAFFRTWYPQMRQTTFNLRCNPNIVLHHGRPGYQFPIRSLRNSVKKSSPPRTPTIETVLENIAVGGPVPISNLWKAFAFTGAFSAGCFISATVMEYENARSIMLDRARKSNFLWPRRKPLESGYWQNLKRELENIWYTMTPGQKVFTPLCALNLLVFGLWRVPALKRIMTTYFCSNPVGRAVCWPMFLSTFSHYSLFHIFANMYVLHSFSQAAVLSLGKEQFLAVYLTGGVIASMGSILYKAIISQAGLSLGASGAIMTVLAYVSAQYPDTQLSILFLPMLTFSAGSAIKVIMGIDLAGCILGWKFFDHAAHLGGALFGIFWAYYGAEVWHQRMAIMNIYHHWRKPK